MPRKAAAQAPVNRTTQPAQRVPATPTRVTGATPVCLRRDDGVIFPYSPALAKLKNFKPLAAYPKSHTDSIKAVQARKRVVADAVAASQEEFEQRAEARRWGNREAAQGTTRDAINGAVEDASLEHGFVLETAELPEIIEHTLRETNTDLTGFGDVEATRAEAQRLLSGE